MPYSAHCAVLSAFLGALQASALAIPSGLSVALESKRPLTLPQEQAPLASEPSAQPSIAVLAFGSCASDQFLRVQPIWGAMAEANPDAVVLLGDTPYIDSTNLEVQMQRYQAFFEMPEVKALHEKVPFWCTWDDHDMGTNDCDGRTPGKEFARKAFMKFHPDHEHGEDDQGVYTSFSKGPVDVFLLDTRWFARTERSAFGDGPTLLGARQWKWLMRRLVESKAPFKILACGMIWNDAVRPAKTDYWGAYPHEREALFRFLGENDIEGVVLVSGDIHRSRVVRHETRELVGYEITELITSPMAQKVIASANVPHPGLVWDVGVEQTCMIVTARDTAQHATLDASFVQTADPDAAREMFSIQLNAEFLRKKSTMGVKGRPQTGFLFEPIQVGKREYPSVTYLPRNWTPERHWPAILFLHGMGESGSDGALQLAQGLGIAVQLQSADWPFVILFPQKPATNDDWEAHDEYLMALLDRATLKYHLDATKIGLSGLSQGGHGTWEIARLHPDRFAALAPICGYPAAPARGWSDFVRERDWTDEAARAASLKLAEVLGRKPVWAFHGEADDAVPARFTTFVVEALRARGAEPKLTLYPGVGHNSWDAAYRDSELAAWFRDQLR